MTPDDVLHSSETLENDIRSFINKVPSSNLELQTAMSNVSRIISTVPRLQEHPEHDASGLRYEQLLPGVEATTQRISKILKDHHFCQNGDCDQITSTSPRLEEAHEHDATGLRDKLLARARSTKHHVRKMKMERYRWSSTESEAVFDANKMLGAYCLALDLAQYALDFTSDANRGPSQRERVVRSLKDAVEYLKYCMAQKGCGSFDTGAFMDFFSSVTEVTGVEPVYPDSIKSPRGTSSSPRYHPPAYRQEPTACGKKSPLSS
ncbi:uncharacterized protein F5Z01DRAFT_674700 [Emericellopsis atlantica]|uniref:Uncharacterized protein n=1 Tax=Emericellopsis atlantica TaxID=2614577 RepID=A0A9P7ZLQ2_9HYPO|nr:uncharacterized protein F5Z01DRAFT_674700 [Emericellopsis atlantica]KAG9253818.1 hypothetical protein F5Z01DRAFT_674700 [Emericellopsis atlantica]